MLFVAALLINADIVDNVKLVYHEAELMVAERLHINMMKEKYGHEKVEVTCFASLPDKKINLQPRTLVLVDEADAAFIDHRIPVYGDGYLLGLTATGLSATEIYENDLICNKLRFLSLSSGIRTDFNEHTVR